MTLTDLLAIMASLGPSSTEDDVRAIASHYKAVRAAFIREAAERTTDGKPDPSLAARQWMQTVWTTPAWRAFSRAWKRYEGADLLDWEFAAFRSTVVALLAGITRESSAKDMQRANGTYRRYRVEYEQACARWGQAGQANRHLAELWATPEWIAFHREKTRRWHTSPAGLEKRRVYAKEHYEKVAKERRSTPEAKAKLAAQRRARYAASKAKKTTTEPSSP